MKRQAVILATATTAMILVTVSANAQAIGDSVQFNVLSSSTIDDVRSIGGQSIQNLAEFDGYGGTLDITDPTNWGLMDADMSTLPNILIDPNSANIDGTLEIDGGNVSSATLNLLGELSMGLFQSTPGWDGVNAERLANMVTTGMVWEYDADTYQLTHNAGATTTCVNVGADGGTGSCNLYANPTRQGGGAAGNSVWNWDGLPDGWTASNSRGTWAFPWGEDCNPDDGCISQDHVVVAEAGGTAGVTWDLTNLDDCLEQGECTITARVVASGMGAAADGVNNTGVSAHYTLNLVAEGRPYAEDDEAEALEPLVPVDIDVLANDSYDDEGAFSLVVIEDGDKGSAVVAGNVIQYTPDADATGTDSFVYRLESSGFHSDATVTVTLAEDNEGNGDGDDNGDDEGNGDGQHVIHSGGGSLDLLLLSLLGSGLLLRRRRKS